MPAQQQVAKARLTLTPRLYLVWVTLLLSCVFVPLLNVLKRVNNVRNKYQTTPELQYEH